jgi:hypothetical protein
MKVEKTSNNLLILLKKYLCFWGVTHFENHCPKGQQWNHPHVPESLGRAQVSAYVEHSIKDSVKESPGFPIAEIHPYYGLRNENFDICPTTLLHKHGVQDLLNTKHRSTP